VIWSGGNSEILALLAAPFAACALFVAIHTNFGLHVLRRGVIFADLALAQMSALGATIAFAAGHAPTSPAGIAYTFLFAAIGAALLTAARVLPKGIQAEAYIGIIYVVATATTIVVVNRSPQGAEHVKQVLVGSILAVSASDLPKFAVVYGAVGAFHWLARRPLLAASEAADGEARYSLLWDFLFYLSFSVVVSSSVATAGVLLVFCFLIIPAIIGSLFTRRIAGALWIGWLGGVAASALGLAASFEFDLPTGAAMVIAFALTLVLGAALRALILRSAEERRIRVIGFFRAISASVLVAVLLAAFWLMIMPCADQPALDLLQSTTGIGPEAFLTVEEREAYGAALNDAHYRQWQLAQLSLSERQSRWQGEELSDTAVRRIGSFQQTFNEMLHGEDFVLKSLSGWARQRERWYIGPPLLIIAMVGLFALLRETWRVSLVQLSSMLCLRIVWAFRSLSRACFPRR
jgi:zinc/manganese transport system permease protein